MIDLARVSAVLVTRGNVDLDPIEEQIRGAGIHDIVVWDNAGRDKDWSVFGRYQGVRHALGDVVYVQDDDCIVPSDSITSLIAGYEPGKITANMPEKFRPHYDDSCLIGFGAVFERGLPGSAFKSFAVGSPPEDSPLEPVTPIGAALAGLWLFQWDPTFRRTCDVVFTTLTPRILLDVEYVDREFASDPDRMWKQPEHVGERARMLERARIVRDARGF